MKNISPLTPPFGRVCELPNTRNAIVKQTPHLSHLRVVRLLSQRRKHNSPQVQYIYNTWTILQYFIGKHSLTLYLQAHRKHISLRITVKHWLLFIKATWNWPTGWAALNHKSGNVSQDGKRHFLHQLCLCRCWCMYRFGKREVMKMPFYSDINNINYRSALLFTCDILPLVTLWSSGRL